LAKRGRPKGLAYKTQTRIISILMDYPSGLNLKTLVVKTGFNKKTVISALKKLCDPKLGIIDKRKVGRYSVYKIVKPNGIQYFHKLRMERLVKETEGARIDFDILFEKRARKLRLHTKKRFPEVSERLLERYDEATKNFKQTLLKIISEIAEEDKKKRTIELD